MAGPARARQYTAMDRRDLLLLPLLLTLEALLLGLDGELRFFLGDSEAFLLTAVTDVANTHRSYLYSYLIRLVGANWLVALQALAGGLSAFLLALTLRAGFGSRRAVAWGAALLLALAPLQLLYERYLMAESLALLGFSLFLAGSLIYLRQRQPLWLVAAQLGGIWAIALRGSYLPVVLGVSLALALVAWRQRPGRGSAAHLLLALAVLLVSHGAFRQFQGQLTQQPAAYQYEGGFFLISALSPLLRADDFPDPQVGGEVLASSAPRTLALREHQRWFTDGVVFLLIKHYGSVASANQVATSATRHVMLRDPLGVLGLMAGNLRAHFDLAQLRRMLVFDRNEDRPLPPDLRLIMERVYQRPLTADAQIGRTTPVGHYHQWAIPWYWLLLLSPPLFAALALLPLSTEQRQGVLLLALTCALVVAIDLLFSTVLVVRYLHPLEWVVLLGLGIVLGGWRGASVKALGLS